MIRPTRGYAREGTNWWKQSSFWKSGVAACGTAAAAYGIFNEMGHLKTCYKIQEIGNQADYEVQKFENGGNFRKVPISQRLVQTSTEYINSRKKTIQATYHLGRLGLLSHTPDQCRAYFRSLPPEDRNKLILLLMREEGKLSDKLLPILLVPGVIQRFNVLVCVNSLHLMGNFWTKREQVLRQIIQTQFLDENSQVRIMADAIFYGDGGIVPFSPDMLDHKIMPRLSTPSSPQLPKDGEWDEEPPLTHNGTLHGGVFYAMLETNVIPEYKQDPVTARVILSDTFTRYASYKKSVVNQEVLAACIGATLSTFPENSRKIQKALKLLNRNTPIPIHGNNPASEEALESLHVRQPIVRINSRV